MKYKSFYLLCEDMHNLKEYYPQVYEKFYKLSQAFVFVESRECGIAYYRVDIQIKEQRSAIKQLIRELILQIYFNCTKKGDHDFHRFMLLSDLHAHLVLLL